MVFVVLIIVGYQYWGLFGTGLAITLAHVFEYVLVNGYAYKKYGYRSSATVYGYAIVQVPLGLLAYILTLVADGYLYWFIGALIVILSGLLSLKALRP